MALVVNMFRLWFGFGFSLFYQKSFGLALVLVYLWFIFSEYLTA